MPRRVQLTLSTNCAASIRQKNGTHRWPLSLYFTLLGICIHNTSVVLFDIDAWTGIRICISQRTDRWRFLDAGKATSRAQKLTEPSNWVTAICEMSNELYPSTCRRGQRTVVGKKGRYCQCGRAKDVKTAHNCQRCGWFVAQFFRQCSVHSGLSTHSLLRLTGWGPYSDLHNKQSTVANWPALTAWPIISSSTCWSQVLRGRPGGRFQSVAGVPVKASMDRCTCSACETGVPG